MQQMGRDWQNDEQTLGCDWLQPGPLRMSGAKMAVVFFVQPGFCLFEYLSSEGGTAMFVPQFSPVFLLSQGGKLCLLFIFV